MKNSEIRPRLSGAKKTNFEYFNSDENRVLVIGDIHAPFDLDGYLDHCKETYERYNCNKVVFIGDVIDNHYSSYHETDANGMGGGEELEYAIKRLAPYYEAFPEAVVLWGNHDRIIMRKAQTSGLPSQWLKDINQVLGTPKWEFMMDYYLDGVRYTTEMARVRLRQLVFVICNLRSRDTITQTSMSTITLVLTLVCSVWL